MIARRFCLPLLAACAGLVLSCGVDGIAPDAAVLGTMTVALTSPNQDDGAVAVTVRGIDLSDIQSASTAYLVYQRRFGPDEARVIVVGNVTPGPLFTVHIGAANQLSKYSASVDQVAMRNDTLRTSLSSYAATLSSGSP